MASLHVAPKFEDPLSNFSSSTMLDLVKMGFMCGIGLTQALLMDVDMFITQSSIQVLEPWGINVKFNPQREKANAKLFCNSHLHRTKLLLVFPLPQSGQMYQGWYHECHQGKCHAQ